MGQDPKKQNAFQKEQRQRKVMNIARKAGNALSIVNGVYKIVEAIIQLSNDKGWYEKFKKITPAMNPGRQMLPMMNTTITKEAALGSVCRMIDVQVDWTEYTQSFAFDQAVRSLYQQLREELKSNMPYKFNAVKAYLIRMIALVTKAKAVERDVHWVNFKDPSMYSFSKLFVEEVNTSAGYGTNSLVAISDYTDKNLGLSQSNWDRLASILNSYAMLPVNLGEFISHYFGSVFVDSSDGYNTQYIKLVPAYFDWAEYDESSDTITYSKINIKDMTMSELIDQINKDSLRFGMITADLARSRRLTTSIQFEYIANWDYVLVYDKTFLQALINGYTDGSALTDNGYVRMDALPGTPDDLTQYLFMGGIFKAWLNSSSNSGGSKALSIVLPLSITRMDLKYSSDDSITWPAGLTQAVTQDPKGQIQIINDFAISIESTISNDSYSTITSFKDAANSQEVAVSSGTFEAAATVTAISAQLNQDKFEIQAPVFKENFSTSTSMYMHVAIPIIRAGSGVLPILTGGGMTYMIYEIPLSLNRQTGIVSLGSSQIQLRMGSFVSGNYNAEVKYAFNQTAYTSGNRTFGVPGTDRNTVILVDSTNIASTYPLWTGNLSVSIQNSAFNPLFSTASLQFAATSSRITIPTAFFGAVISAGTTLTISSLNDSVAPISITAVYVTYSSVSADSVNIAQTNGFALLAAFTADQCDYHIPFIVTSSSQANGVLDSGTPVSSSLQNGRVLVKEAYIPYFYNVADLVSVIYDMFYSLVATGNIPQNMARTSKKNKSKKQKGGKEGESNPSKKEKTV